MRELFDFRFIRSDNAKVTIFQKLLYLIGAFVILFVARIAVVKFYLGLDLDQLRLRDFDPVIYFTILILYPLTADLIFRLPLKPSKSRLLWSLIVALSFGLFLDEISNTHISFDSHFYLKSTVLIFIIILLRFLTEALNDANLADIFSRNANTISYLSIALHAVFISRNFFTLHISVLAISLTFFLLLGFVITFFRLKFGFLEGLFLNITTSAIGLWEVAVPSQ